MVVTLPFVLLLLDVWPLGRLFAPSAAGNNRPALVALEKVPLFLLSAVSCVLTYLAQSRGGSVNMAGRQHLIMRIPNAVMSYGRYLLKTAWPERLAIFYPLPPKPPPVWMTLSVGAGLLSVTILCLWWWRRRPYLALGWFWYLGTLVPVIGLVQVGGQAYADRYTYLPLIGVVAAVAWLADDLARGRLPSAVAPADRRSAAGGLRSHDRPADRRLARHRLPLPAHPGGHRRQLDGPQQLRRHHGRAGAAG